MPHTVYATPLPWCFQQEEKKNKKVWYSLPNVPSLFIFFPWGNSLNTIFLGIEEPLTLNKFQNIYVSKAFLDFEAEVREGAHGIEEGKNSRMEAWGWIVIFDINH